MEVSLKHPKINDINDIRTKENIIQKDYINQIFGNYLHLPGYEIDSISITSKTNITQSSLIKLKDLDIIMHKSNEFIFVISRYYMPPPWLSDGVNVFIKLRYRSENGYISETDSFESRWVL
ncbi:MAG: hypothetical protein JXB50_03060 [Spirochaetes bacterium]|nr:hypothetical protein [Spirochaetota bacterium]